MKTFYIRGRIVEYYEGMLIDAHSEEEAIMNKSRFGLIKQRKIRKTLREKHGQSIIEAGPVQESKQK